MSQLAIWCSQLYSDELHAALVSGAAPKTVVLAVTQNASNLSGVPRDPRLITDCDIALGQPDPLDIIESTSLKWVHLTSAGYTRYDTPAVREAVAKKQVVITNSSPVYDEPCAQHALAMLLAMTRQLPRAIHNQPRKHWNYASIRADSRLLGDLSIGIVGFGTIAVRLVELLTPFKPRIVGFRRTPTGQEPVPTHPIAKLDQHLPTLDVVVNILPASASTANFFDADRFPRFKPGSLYLNIGRGDTNDQSALANALGSGQLAHAFLDVTTPEPLPQDSTLWTLSNCSITPHTAGGWDREFDRQLGFFLENLARYRAGHSLLGRILA